MNLIHKTPFYPQKWDLSRWQDLGFESLEDAKYWEKSSCGVLCLKMAIDGFLQELNKPRSPSISGYIKKGVKIGAYKDSTGWSHSGLVDLAKEFGFLAVAPKNIEPNELLEILKQNFLPIISIKWAFENDRTPKERILFWKKLGGHLALVVGYKNDGGKLKGFYVHHTSILAEYNWRYKFVPIEKFKKGFTRRCIIIKVIKGAL